MKVENVHGNLFQIIVGKHGYVVEVFGNKLNERSRKWLREEGFTEEELNQIDKKIKELKNETS
ncbi:MAG: hypothetical protein J7L03_06525 [Caldisericaceae bacterium]|nr:hypothetical protein [Caldisericaceae bacterium]